MKYSIEVTFSVIAFSILMFILIGIFIITGLLDKWYIITPFVFILLYCLITVVHIISCKISKKIRL